jgi:hypothetical protein
MNFATDNVNQSKSDNFNQSYTLEEGEKGSALLEKESATTSLDVLSFITDILALLNMAVNPFLYIYRLPK